MRCLLPETFISQYYRDGTKLQLFALVILILVEKPEIRSVIRVSGDICSEI